MRIYLWQWRDKDKHGRLILGQKYIKTFHVNVNDGWRSRLGFRVEWSMLSYLLLWIILATPTENISDTDVFSGWIFGWMVNCALSDMHTLTITGFFFRDNNPWHSSLLLFCVVANGADIFGLLVSFKSFQIQFLWQCLNVKANERLVTPATRSSSMFAEVLLAKSPKI